MGRLNRYVFEVDEKLFETENLFEALRYLQKEAKVVSEKFNIEKLKEESAVADVSKDELRHFSITKEGYQDEPVEKCNFCSRLIQYKACDGTSKKILSDESTYFDREQKELIVSYEMFEDYLDKDTQEIIPTILRFLNENKYLKRNAGFKLNQKPIALREDDAKLLVDIFSMKKPVICPILVVKEETDEVKEFNKQMQGMLTVFVNGDEDILEELNDINCKYKDALLELLVADYACIVPSLANKKRFGSLYMRDIRRGF